MPATFPDAPTALDRLFAEVLAEGVVVARRLLANRPKSAKVKRLLRDAEETFAHYRHLLPGADAVVAVDECEVRQPAQLCDSAGERVAAEASGGGSEWRSDAAGRARHRRRPRS